MGADPNQRLREEAAQWFARMRGPDAARHQAAFDAWRATPENRETYARLAEHFEASAVLATSRLAGLRPATSPRPLGLSADARIALVACLVAAIGAVAFVIARPPPTSSGGEQYATTLGEIRTIALPDGATLILDTDSAAATQTDHGRQRVRLQRGRARLTAPRTQALALEAGDARLRVQDATLDLAVGPERQVEVTVIAGKPQLATGQRWLLRQVRYQPLTPGRVRLVPGEPTTNLKADALTEAAWPQGLRTFQKAPLASVAYIANRYDRRKIRFDDPGIGRLEVSGVFKVTQTDRLAQALARTFGLTVTTAPGGDLVLSRQAA